MITDQGRSDEASGRAYPTWRGSWLAGGGAVLVTALLALSQGALGAAPHLVTYHAPFSGTVSSNNIYGSVSGCKSTQSGIVHPKWTQSTGAIVMGASVKSLACGVANSGSGTYENFAIYIAIPIAIAKNGYHNVSVKWNFTGALTKAIHVGGKCPPPVINSYGYGYSSCDASAYTSFGAEPHVEDLTNHTYWYPSNYWGGATNGTSLSTYEDCYGSTCNFGNSTSNSYGGLGVHSFTWWINATASKGDKVIVVFYVYADANAYAYGYAKASASASFNLATLGNGGYLDWIKVT